MDRMISTDFGESRLPGKRGGESILHFEIKEAIAKCLRGLGYYVDVEHKSKRAVFDIWAEAPNGRTLAVEVHLSHAPAVMRSEVEKLILVSGYKNKPDKTLLSFTQIRNGEIQTSLDEERRKNAQLIAENLRLSTVIKGLNLTTDDIKHEDGCDIKLKIRVAQLADLLKDPALAGVAITIPVYHSRNGSTFSETMRKNRKLKLNGAIDDQDRSNAVSDEEHARMVTLYRDIDPETQRQNSMAKVGKLVDRSPTTVQNQLVEHDVSVKGQGYCERCRRAATSE